MESMEASKSNRVVFALPDSASSSTEDSLRMSNCDMMNIPNQPDSMPPTCTNKLAPSQQQMQQRHYSLNSSGASFSSDYSSTSSLQQPHLQRAFTAESMIYDEDVEEDDSLQVDGFRFVGGVSDVCGVLSREPCTGESERPVKSILEIDSDVYAATSREPCTGERESHMRSISSAEKISVLKNVETDEGSSESDILNSESKALQPLEMNNPMTARIYSLRCQKISASIINLMNRDGISIVDNFLGNSVSHQIFQVVQSLYDNGRFMDGQVVVQSHNTQQIRGDKIIWADGTEPGLAPLAYLISYLDSVMVRCNGHLGKYDINGRTKAMVACYPGAGTKYIKHVDNPHQDGRCMTCIYYINKHWDVARDGGLLKIYPRGKQKVADISPNFDRLISFWSDSRNPHEVMPAWRTRFAITVWYFDKEEREAALQRSKVFGHVSNDPKLSASALSPRFHLKDLESQLL